MLTTPALAFLPNNVPCGPRSTSMRSMSTRSLNASPARLYTTPSTTAETDGSPASENVDVPTPRRNSDWLIETAPLRNVSDGTRYCAFSIFTPPWLARAAPEITDTATGTSCNRSVRFCAVTTISAGASSAAGAVSCANAGAPVRANAATLASMIVFVIICFLYAYCRRCGVIFRSKTQFIHRHDAVFARAYFCCRADCDGHKSIMCSHFYRLIVH